MNDQVSTNDILEAINASSSETQKQFDEIQEQLKGMATKQDIRDMATKQDIRDMATKQDIRDMATKQDLRGFQLHIIDKMSEGFADIEGTTVSRQRKEDQKVNLILDLLERHKVVPMEEIEHVRSIRLFPQVVE